MYVGQSVGQLEKTNFAIYLMLMILEFNCSPINYLPLIEVTARPDFMNLLWCVSLGRQVAQCVDYIASCVILLQTVSLCHRVLISVRYAEE